MSESEWGSQDLKTVGGGGALTHVATLTSKTTVDAAGPETDNDY